MKSLFVSISIVMCISVNAQLKIHSNGEMTLTTQSAAWDCAMRTYVPHSFATSYALSHSGRDVFYVSAQGWSWSLQGGYTSSDINLKKNITTIQSPISTLMKLEGVSYDYKSENESDESSNGQRMGVIAQDVEKVIPGIVKTVQNGFKAVAYDDFIGLLIESVKEQQRAIEELRSELTKLSADATLDNVISKKTADTEESYLNQNTPNPFNQATEITFFIGQEATSARIIIYNMNGLEVQAYPIKEFGKQEMTIEASGLQAGLYNYALIVDKKIIDIKKMILTK